jgi:CheY-like chemotaxis protein
LTANHSADAAIATTASAPLPVDALATKPTVLIVEDEPLLRLLAAERPGDAGFETIEAGNADEAVEILALGTDVAVLLTDVAMPGSMDGLALAATVHDRWPPVGIVVTSGCAAVAPADMPADSLFVAKPHDWPQVISALGRVST